jgi:hypothetical protein
LPRDPHRHPELLGPEHIIIGVVEADDIERVRDFVLQPRIAQWNTVKVNATWTMEQAIEESAGLEPFFEGVDHPPAGAEGCLTHDAGCGVIPPAAGRMPRSWREGFTSA